MSLLAVPKGKKIKAPEREPDMVSKRGKAYWFGPEWVREAGKSYGRILPVADDYGNVYLHMLSKTGNLSYIQGSIQEEFQWWKRTHHSEIVPWRDDMEADCILLGVDIADVLASDWEYE